MDSLHLLNCACRQIRTLMKDVSFSSVYQTRAMYVLNQEDFFNMTALGYVNDDEDPFEFLEKIHRIEASFGRDRSKEIRFGPRPLDIDIELFGNLSINTEILQIPHPRIKERAFVLIPAIEILKKSTDVNDIEIYKVYSDLISKLNVTIKEENVSDVSEFLLKKASVGSDKYHHSEVDGNTLVKLLLPEDFFS